MEDPMKNLIFRRIVLIAALVLIAPAIGSCGSKMEGTYTNTGGMVTLDLKSGGKATLTLMGDPAPCTYKVKDDKVMLDCTPKGEKVDFMIHGDGSLTGPSFIGSMKKLK
jgi:hypothetical protein